MKQKKLQLKKKVIATLSEEQKSKIIGGDDDTSYAECPTAITECANTCGEGCGSDTCPTYFCVQQQA
jgi:hypothetical protein